MYYGYLFSTKIETIFITLLKTVEKVYKTNSNKIIKTSCILKRSNYRIQETNKPKNLMKSFIISLNIFFIQK